MGGFLFLFPHGRKGGCIIFGEMERKKRRGEEGSREFRRPGGLFDMYIRCLWCIRWIGDRIPHHHRPLHVSGSDLLRAL